MNEHTIDETRAENEGMGLMMKLNATKKAWADFAHGILDRVVTDGDHLSSRHHASSCEKTLLGIEEDVNLAIGKTMREMATEANAQNMRVGEKVVMTRKMREIFEGSPTQTIDAA